MSRVSSFLHLPRGQRVLVSSVAGPPTAAAAAAAANSRTATLGSPFFGPMTRKEHDYGGQQLYDSIQFDSRTYRIHSSWESHAGRIVRIRAFSWQAHRGMLVGWEQLRRPSDNGAAHPNLRVLGKLEWLPVQWLREFVHECTIVRNESEWHRRMHAAAEKRRASRGSQPAPRIYFREPSPVPAASPVAAAAASAVVGAADQSTVLRAEIERLRTELATSKATSMWQEVSLTTSQRQLADSITRATSFQDACARAYQSRDDAQHRLASLEQMVRSTTEQAELTSQEARGLRAELASTQVELSSLRTAYSEAINNADHERTQLQAEIRQLQPAAAAAAASRSNAPRPDARLIRVKREVLDAQETAVVATHQKRRAESALNEESRKRRRAEDALEEEKEGAACALCMDARADVVFRPCNHLVCCSACADALPKPECPRCQQKIRKRVSVSA